MPQVVRDRTARSRIRNYLAERGPIVDPSGRATAVLKDAIGYQGSSVAFIQLVTAMDKSAEIEREIRGKRTYRISGQDRRLPAAPAQGRGSAVSVASLSAPAASGPQLDLDYDEL